MKVGRKQHRQKNDERQVRGGRKEGLRGRKGEGMYLVVHGNGVLGVEGEHEGAAKVDKK